jgi:hypothetical protein
MIVFGLWGFLVELAIIFDVLGPVGVIAGLILFPITFFVAPWYALFVDGSWFPLVLVYGGGIPGRIIMTIGQSILGSGKFEEGV